MWKELIEMACTSTSSNMSQKVLIVLELEFKETLTSNSLDDIVNEINNFLECRCVTPNDGSWRLLQFDIHYTDQSVKRLPVHLPFENNVIFTEDYDLEEVLENSNNVITKLTSWLEINSCTISIRSYTYIEFPEHFTWHEDGKYWTTRHKRHNKSSRIAHVSPTQ
jgi:hypothetical protein